MLQTYTSFLSNCLLKSGGEPLFTFYCDPFSVESPFNKFPCLNPKHELVSRFLESRVTPYSLPEVSLFANVFSACSGSSKSVPVAELKNLQVEFHQATEICQKKFVPYWWETAIPNPAYSSSPVNSFTTTFSSFSILGTGLLGQPLREKLEAFKTRWKTLSADQQALALRTEAIFGVPSAFLHRESVRSSVAYVSFERYIHWLSHILWLQVTKDMASVFLDTSARKQKKASNPFIAHIQDAFLDAVENGSSICFWSKAFFTNVATESDAPYKLKFSSCYSCVPPPADYPSRNNVNFGSAHISLVVATLLCSDCWSTFPSALMFQKILLLLGICYSDLTRANHITLMSTWMATSLKMFFKEQPDIIFAMPIMASLLKGAAKPGQKLKLFRSATQFWHFGTEYKGK